jgi:hypothetical protein
LLVARVCVRTRTNTHALMHVRAPYINDHVEFMFIYFWLRISALRVSLVATRLTVYRRYQMTRKAEVSNYAPAKRAIRS